MSALRNAVQRRNHKERAQPLERKKWGLLEKHKDYSLRAKDHNAKKQRIKTLQQKASERNEDEFYFGMMSSKTKGGVKISQRAQDNSGGQHGAGRSLNHDVVQLMKTQDCAYLRTVLQSTRRAAERMEKEVIILEHGVSRDGTSTGRTTFDVEEEEPAAINETERHQHDEESLDDLLALAEQEYADVLSKAGPLPSTKTPTDRKKQHTLEVRQRQLDVLRERQQQLTTVLRELEDQRARMSGTTGGVNKSGTKFKLRQRQR